MRGTSGLSPEARRALFKKRVKDALERAICQACGEFIAPGADAIRVSYGRLHVTAHPHLQLVGRDEQDDYFHRACTVAVREEL